MHPDRERQLPVADPEGRLLTISCGTALHHARIALAAAGWEPVVQRFPDPEQPELLARITLGAHIGVAPEAMHHFQTAEIRRTDRRPLSNVPVPPDAIAAVRDAVAEQGARLHVLRAEQVSVLAVAVARAEALSAEEEPLREELARWVGGSRPEGTGLPDASIPLQPPHTTVPQRDFGAPGTLTAPGEGTDRYATYAVIFGDQDNPAGWLPAGEALSAAWLVATEHGVSLLPFSAPVEASVTRVTLLGILSGLGQPYLAVRLGIPDPDHAGPPHTPRLDPTQTVEFADG